jgi:hypothetical protein
MVEHPEWGGLRGQEPVEAPASAGLTRGGIYRRIGIHSGPVFGGHASIGRGPLRTRDSLWSTQGWPGKVDTVARTSLNPVVRAAGLLVLRHIGAFLPELALSKARSGVRRGVWVKVGN